MPTPNAPTAPVSPPGMRTARPRACVEQIARRQPTPQRVGRRAKRLVALEAGAHNRPMARQRPRTRGPVGLGRPRGLALPPPRAQGEADGVRATALPTRSAAGLTAPPRPGTPATACRGGG